MNLLKSLVTQQNSLQNLLKEGTLDATIKGIYYQSIGRITRH